MKRIARKIAKDGEGEVTLTVEDIDDLWYLSQAIDPGDRLSGRTLRKMRSGEPDERGQVASRKPVRLTITVEKVEAFTHGDTLRALGTITDGPEDIPRGTHHSFAITPGTTVTLTKRRWLSFQLARLEEAEGRRGPGVLVCVMDREEAMVARITRQGFETLVSLTAAVPKKGDPSVTRNNLYLELEKKLAELARRHDPARIIVASPGFFKEDFIAGITDASLKGKILAATTNHVGEPGVNEVLRRPETAVALADSHAAAQLRQVDLLFAGIAAGGKAAYGREQVTAAAVAGAVEALLVTDGLIASSREKGSYGEVERAMLAAEAGKGTVHIIESANDAGRRLDGVGGIGALLRYVFST
ncbi:mRNA surveillance protein pelota [Candidatus Woesearchaeota archaeon]|nr:mRNA surveillance protein pelota [Candidatus Woesearchaeota archaeon]